MTSPAHPTLALDPMLLSAWLDGELEGAERAQADAWLASHADDAERVRLWALDRAMLREQLAPTLDEPIPEHLRQLVLGGGRGARTWGGASTWRIAAAAAGLLLTGGVIGAALITQTQWQTPSQSQLAALEGTTPRAVEWVQRAAVAHAVYAPELRHPVDVNTAEGSAEEQRKNEEHLSRWLTRRLAMPVTLFDLRSQGFELVGGRLLPDVPASSAQLMYQNSSGQRITVYLRKPEVDTPAAFRFERQGELNLFYWVDGPTGYALVGPLPRERLLALAEAIYRQGAKAATAAPGS